MREVKITQAMLEDSICNLSAYKTIMQERFKKVSFENKGETDAVEFGRDIDIAIDSMKILLSSFPEYAGTVEV